ncbi:DUF1911 domain-containing protein [Pseudoalteromonas sp. Isolate6]|nr:DUF1911 domain-containing protein [Pseudoalteromonas sp. Isolate6]
MISEFKPFLLNMLIYRQWQKDYLDAWYVLEGSPDYHLMATDAYIGYWCWEIALVVTVFNIDDSSFINHPYYPKDLVHWQDNQ